MDDPHAGAASSPDPGQELWRLWRQGQQPDVDAFLARLPSLTPAQAAALLCIDQHERWQAGQRVLAETYLGRHPELHADPEAIVDLIYHEYLIRERLGEQPSLAEYQQRFPAQAEMLQTQIEFHRAVQPDSADLNTVTGPQRTSVPRETVPSARAEWLALAPAVGGSRSEREVAALLRTRLLFIAVLYTVAIAAYVLIIVKIIVGSFSPLFSLLCAETTALGVLLWSNRPLSLRQLRWIEAALFAPLALLTIDFQFRFLYDGGFEWAATNGWKGLISLGGALSVTWIFQIVTYGILIPNTWRRCAAACGLIALCPLLHILALGVLVPGIEFRLLAHLLVLVATCVTFASALAVYGSHRIEVLRQQALEARRLGPYQLKRRLGSGGMGEVYLAEHVLLRRPCAIKIIRPERAGQPHDRQRFEREVQVTATLTHPNTVQVFDYGHADDGTFYYAMEYLPGLNLEELIAEDGPLPAGRAVHLLRQVCQALHEAHSIGLIHRDLKPGNIIVGRRGGLHDVAKLLDFGLVQAPRRGPDETRLTQEGDIAGTPAFMSPEQAAGENDLGPASDLYSLGALAFFLLTGHPPFTSASAIKVLAAHLYEAPPLLTDYRSDLPAELQAIVLRCLAKDPADRFPDAESLERVLAGCPLAERWSEEQAAAWWRSRSSADPA
jgi:serine/threonine-protein kinase